MKGKRKMMPLPLVILFDILLAAATVFTVFIAVFKPRAPQPAVPAAAPAPTAAEENVKEETQEPKTEGKTPWQIKFGDKFSEQVISTENSYKSPDISIEIETLSTEETVYHLADIYIASADNFKTYTANGEFRYFSSQDALEMDAASGAIIAISGDFYSYQSSGLLVRNSQVYMDDDAYCDICVMFPDGSIETLSRGEYDKEEILARNPLQIWNFGPSLLDAEGKVKPYYEASDAVSYKNPRSALGYYEPGHYCFLIADGRQEDYSAGFTLPELAEIFQQLGCTSAYNLDGGGSAVMTFNDARYSRQSNGGRELGDILLICEREKTE